MDEARRVYDALVPIGPILVIFFFASLAVFVISLLLFAARAERR